MCAEGERQCANSTTLQYWTQGFEKEVSRVASQNFSVCRVSVVCVVVLIGLAVLPASIVQAQDPVRLRTVFGDIFVDLDPESAPATVANFLDYLANGDYEDTFFHQSSPGGAGTPQILVAGRFRWPEDSPTGIVPVPVREPVANEFNRSNVRGTIAMLAPDGQPDGATNTWLINIADNGELNMGGLDTLNGGATVFGTINAAGMEVADAINAECIEDRGVDFPELPVLGSSTADIRREQLFLITETREFEPVAAPLSALLPGSRSIGQSDTATAFATILNTSDAPAASCRIQPITNVPATFEYFQTDPLTNQAIGEPNPEIDIEANGFTTLVFAFSPINTFASTEIEFDFSCGNADAAASRIVGVNTFVLAALGDPGADVVAVAATAGNNGIADVSLTSRAGAFAVATTNVGVTETITVRADSGSAVLPVDLLVCESNPETGACLAPPTETVVVAMEASSTFTFSVFALLTENDAVVAFNPGANRAFVRFENSSGEIRGSSSVALRTVD